MESIEEAEEWIQSLSVETYETLENGEEHLESRRNDPSSEGGSIQGSSRSAESTERKPLLIKQAQEALSEQKKEPLSGHPVSSDELRRAKKSVMDLKHESEVYARGQARLNQEYGALKHPEGTEEQQKMEELEKVLTALSIEKTTSQETSLNSSPNCRGGVTKANFNPCREFEADYEKAINQYLERDFAQKMYEHSPEQEPEPGDPRLGKGQFFSPH
ncbi:hypothetical protein TCAL_14437 [Tigriopus californicus]|uniref:PH domain-containing protein n=1 Tax=Tigriopus californicus TaxID=6832 RepID=A0A553PLT0_TIGCA|nr:hypothetical protein TCAL_14437 [Tigriopus californicus]